MSKFKVGDVVRRHAGYMTLDWCGFCWDLRVPEDCTLTVTGLFGDSLILEGVTRCSWDPRYFKLVQVEDPQEKAPTAPDAVNSPKHYQFFPDLEAIEVIVRSMTKEQFYGYCLGNRLKYRLRAGNKDKLEQDIAKSDKYLELYEQHNGKCIDA